MRVDQHNAARPRTTGTSAAPRTRHYMRSPTTRWRATPSLVARLTARRPARRKVRPAPGHRPGRGRPDLVAYSNRVPDTRPDGRLADRPPDRRDRGRGYTQHPWTGASAATYDSDVLVMPVWLGCAAIYGVDARQPEGSTTRSRPTRPPVALVGQAGWGKLGGLRCAQRRPLHPGVTSSASPTRSCGRGRRRPHTT